MINLVIAFLFLTTSSGFAFYGFCNSIHSEKLIKQKRGTSTRTSIGHFNFGIFPVYSQFNSWTQDMEKRAIEIRENKDAGYGFAAIFGALGIFQFIIFLFGVFIGTLK